MRRPDAEDVLTFICNAWIAAFALFNYACIIFLAAPLYDWAWNYFWKPYLVKEGWLP